MSCRLASPPLAEESVSTWCRNTAERIDHAPIARGDSGEVGDMVAATLPRPVHTASTPAVPHSCGEPTVANR